MGTRRFRDNQRNPSGMIILTLAPAQSQRRKRHFRELFGSLMVKGWVSLSLRDEVVLRLDAYIESNVWGYRNRAEVVTAALRQFLEGPPLSREELRQAILAVRATEPETVDDMLSALLAELDLKVRKPPHQATTSSSESTKRL